MREIKTEAAALAAVGQDGWALRYVPEALKSEELCAAAVRQNHDALYFMPKAMRATVRAAAWGGDGE